MAKAADVLIASEDDEQKAVLEFCDIYHMPYFHVNNEMWSTSFKQKARATAMGVKSGVPDLFIFVPIGQPVGAKSDKETYYQMVVVEMKRRQGGTLSKTQKEWRAIFQAALVPHCVAHGAQEAITFLKECQAYYKIKQPGEVQTR